jgi:hypothetical protein
VSESKADHDLAATAPTFGAATEPAGATVPLSDLMAADPNAPAATAKGPDLDAAALAAAQAAIAEGERALAAARSQLASSAVPVAAPHRWRELALRFLLAANVLAMLGIALLPPSATPVAPVVDDPVAKAPEAPDAQPTGTLPTNSQPKATPSPRLGDAYGQALLAAGEGDFARAIVLLEQYLAGTPRMAPSQQINVLLALEHYSLQVGNATAAQGYRQRVLGMQDSHSLPADLVAMAQAAAANGDQESLRRVWARFLLQQRQVPTPLYKHVAEAYLQLGDSYRLEANTSAEQQRLQQLQEQAARMAARQLESQGKADEGKAR